VSWVHLHLRRSRSAAGDHGIDMNPFAVSITRFRLLIAAVRACGATSLADLSQYGWRINVAVGDSLLDDPFAGEYEVAVGNPPYMTVRDQELDRLYRRRYDACVGKYALPIPFAQRFFGLARQSSMVTQHACTPSAPRNNSGAVLFAQTPLPSHGR
jgi:hypothetical protein